MRRLSRRKFRTRDAVALINLARTTVGIQEGLEGLVMDSQHILSQAVRI
ncbi:MAG: hypothetical protein ACLPX5_16600 [Dissulfurispiraceae bacterium]